MDFLVWLDTCIFQMDAIADECATCIWILYFNITVMPEEKNPVVTTSLVM